MIRIGGKMPLTFDRETYAELLAQSQPKVIGSDNENEKAIALEEESSHQPTRSPEQDACRTQFVYCGVGCEVRSHFYSGFGLDEMQHLVGAHRDAPLQGVPDSTKNCHNTQCNTLK
jgi:hypothetical protein